MKIIEIKNRDSLLMDQLCLVWRDSVTATHFFLSALEIEKIAQYIPSALESVNHLIVAMNNKNEPVGFMGINQQILEMLFILPNELGKGLGKQLMLYALQNYSINQLCVNEQNPKAKGFYEHMGFEVYKRNDRDEQNDPYPIMYMKYIK